MRAIVPLLLLVTVVAVVASIVIAASRSRSQVSAGQEHLALESTARATLERVKALAWEYRDVDGALAEVLLQRIRTLRDTDASGVRRGAPADSAQACLDDCAEAAWQHREDCPGLSLAVLDLLRPPPT